MLLHIYTSFYGRQGQGGPGSCSKAPGSGEEEGRRREVANQVDNQVNQVDNQAMVVNQKVIQGGADVDNQQRMVVLDQRVGGGAGGGAVGQPHHQADHGRAAQAVQGVETHQGRSIENSAEFGDVAQYRELNAIGTGQHKLSSS